MQLTELFEQAVANSKLLSEKPANDILLKLYGLYKQSTSGNVNIEVPSNPVDFVARAKYAAWEELKSKPKAVAMQDYIDLVNKLKG